MIFKKKIIFPAVFLFASIFLTGLISADLCKASDGYFYDCGYNSGYSNYGNYGMNYNPVNYDSSDNYYSKMMPGNYGMPSYSNQPIYLNSYSGPTQSSYFDNLVYVRDVQSVYSDSRNYQMASSSTIISQTTQLDSRTNPSNPSYPSSRYNANYGNYQNQNCQKNPDSYWRNKEPYNSADYKNANYDNYYYKPRDDWCRGYNWRW